MKKRNKILTLRGSKSNTILPENVRSSARTLNPHNVMYSANIVRFEDNKVRPELPSNKKKLAQYGRRSDLVCEIKGNIS